MKKVIVVDDEPDFQLLFQQHFRRERKAGQIDFRFECSGDAALNYLQNQGEVDIFLLLTDINMPGLNGLDLLKIVKSKFSDLKVFVITAYGTNQHYQRAMEYGADAYMTKPIDFSLLKQKLFGLCETRGSGVLFGG